MTPPGGWEPPDLPPPHHPQVIPVRVPARDVRVGMRVRSDGRWHKVMGRRSWTSHTAGVTGLELTLGDESLILPADMDVDVHPADVEGGSL